MVPSAVAATSLGKNTVGNSQIKKNAISTGKVREGAITGSKLKNGSVTGSKINLSTIGTVPSATNAEHAKTAESANTATTAQSATNATNFSRYINLGMVKAALGRTVTLATVGPFTLSGECEDNAGEPIARVILTTTSPGSSETGYEDTYNENDFNPGVEAETTYEASNGAKPEMNENYGGYYAGFNAITGNGSTIISGEVVNGVNIVGASCVYFGHVLNES